MECLEMNKKYDSLADKTAAEMANEHLLSAYELFKSVHPECGGFSAEVTEIDEDGTTRTRIGLLMPQTKIKKENWEWLL